MTTSTTPLPYGITPPSYRLPDAAHVGRVHLQVADLARSLEYYETIIGLQLLERTAQRAVLGAGGRPLVELHEKPGVRPVTRRGHIGLYHFAILLPDRAALGRFVAHLGEIGAYAGMSDHFVSEAVYLTDPDGLGIEVYADRPRSDWRWDDRQLTMTTVPLNVRDLVASANGERWTGAPAGTTIGHIHLYVRDLAEAEALYHRALGFDKVVWNYPGALFMSAGGYHHHLGTNTWAAASPLAQDDDARLLEWEIVVPTSDDVRAAASNVEASGYAVAHDGNDAIVRDPAGSPIRLVAEA